jgi:hypothetical protein
MNGQSTPQFVQAILEWQWTWPIARFALVVYYLISGLGKITNFRGAVAEMAQADMPAPAAMALLTIFVELAGSALVLEGVGPGTDPSDYRLPNAHWPDRRFRALRPHR